MENIIILCPVYNDEDCFNAHALKLEDEIKKLHAAFSFLVINDGSLIKPNLKPSLPATIIHLHRNIGHQKAIATGLAYAVHHLQFDKIVIMDCDGEDRAEDIVKLVNASLTNEGVIFAHRYSRQENISFKFHYSAYKFIFKVLTGQSITFGNFMLLSKSVVEKIIYYSEIWSHLAGAILKSKTPFITIPTHRGRRYLGSSKMNFTNLLLHGLGAIGVFIEVVATRLLIFSITLILLSLLAIVITIVIKFFSQMAIPGWATVVASSMMIILLQSFLLSLFTVFLYISSTTQRKLIPAIHYNDYIRAIEIKT